MTPPAATQAGRRAAAPKSRVKAGTSPRVPRRVSGPVAGAAAVPGRLAPPARRPAAKPARPARRATQSGLPLGVRALAYVRALPDHRWLDRLVRGRAWIPVLGILLTGIVAMQVEVLKLGASVGRSMSLATELQSRNQLLRASVARLSDDQRIMREAARMGLVMPGPTEIQFVPAAGSGGLAKAIGGIQAPNAQTFLSDLAAQESADGVTNPLLGTAPTTGSTAVSGTSTSTSTSTSATVTGASAATGAAAPAAGSTTSGAAAAGAGPATGATAGSATAPPTSQGSSTGSTSTAAGSGSTPSASTGGVAAG